MSYGYYLKIDLTGTLTSVDPRLPTDETIPLPPAKLTYSDSKTGLTYTYDRVYSSTWVNSTNTVVTPIWGMHEGGEKYLNAWSFSSTSLTTTFMVTRQAVGGLVLSDGSDLAEANEITQPGLASHNSYYADAEMRTYLPFGAGIGADFDYSGVTPPIVYDDFYWVYVGSALFTAYADAIDFNNLSPSLLDAISYDALGGDDAVTLPSIAKAAQIGFSLSKVFHGSAGNDSIYGSDGNNHIEGDEGADFVDGVYGNDVINGGSGNDILFGNLGDDKLDGGANDDNLDGGSGDDELTGGTGNDFLAGGGDDDTIHGGANNDVLVGGSGTDVLYGEAGDDQFQISGWDEDGTGSDNLTDKNIGGTGADEFRIYDYPLSSWKPQTPILIFGGTETSDDAATTVDKMWFYPDASNYEIRVTSLGTGWMKTATTISVAGQHRLTLYGVELAEFAQPMSNNVELSGGNVITEMLRLSSEVYGPLKTLEHKAEGLAVRSGQDIDDLAVSRHWHAVAAIELGMRPGDYGAYGQLNYSFIDGHYAAIDRSDAGAVSGLMSDVPEANAMVLTGLVDGKKTVALTFRGTDQWADFDDYPNFARHYDKFKPLITALNKYVEDNHIEQVLVSGHSLGAGMVQAYLADHANVDGGVTYRGFTIGSPGGDEGHGRDNRILNFVDTDDIVPLAASIPMPLVALGLAGLGVASGNASLAKALVTLGLKLQGKTRDGVDIRFDSGVSDSYNTDEHTNSLYVAHLAKLLSFAADPNAAASFRTNQVILDLLAGKTPSAGLQVGMGTAVRSDPSVQHPYFSGVGDVTIGTSFSDVIHNPESADRFVLGNAGVRDTLDFTDWTRLGASKDGRLFDGGGDEYDQVILNPIYGVQAYDYRQIGGVWTIFYRVAENTPWIEMVQLHRVDRIIDNLGHKVKDIGTAAANVQKPSWAAGGSRADAAAATPPVFTIDSSYDYADAGNGAMTVVGTSKSDVIFFGLGAKTINGNGGDDIIANNKTAAGAAAVTLNGGAGNDALSSGAGNDQLTGGDGDDHLDGGTGKDNMQGGKGDDFYTVDSSGDVVDEGTDGADGIDTVLASIAFSLASKQVRGTVENLTLTGAASLSATGNDRDNAITGNAGANRIDGGAGRDAMEGLGGNDTYYVDNSGDRVVEASGGGNDSVFSSVSFSLAGQFAEKLTLTGSANSAATGNALNNTLTGNTGDNTLDGGLGADTVKGGAGDDVFVFDTALGGSNIDFIGDFKHADDTIRLDRGILGLKAGTLAQAAFYVDTTGGHAAKTTSQHIIYDRQHGTLWFDADGKGSAAAVEFAVLGTNSHPTNLAADDFAVV